MQSPRLKQGLMLMMMVVGAGCGPKPDSQTPASPEPKGGEREKEELVAAKLEQARSELEKEGWTKHGAYSVQTFQRVFTELEDGVEAEAQELLQVADKIEELHGWQEIKELEELLGAGAFDLFGAYGLEVVEVMPDATGQESSAENPFDIGGPVTDPLGVNTFSFAAIELSTQDGSSTQGRSGGWIWHRTHPTRSRQTGWQSTSDGGRTSSVEARSAVWQWGERGPSGSAVRKTVYSDRVVVTKEVYNDQGEVVSESSHTTPTESPDGAKEPPKESPEASAPPIPHKEKLKGYQPSDGTGEQWCPLFLWYCREALAAILSGENDPRSMVKGTAHVRPPPPDAASEGNAPLLRVDREGLVINPPPHEANSAGGSRPIKMRLAFPVMVLPPRPGFGADPGGTGGAFGGM